MIRKKLGFTLGEILIALTVIGVVAVLVMPQLVLGQKAAQAQAQFNTAYSLLAKTIADMDADDILKDPKTYATREFYNTFRNYNKITIDCGGINSSTNTSVCPTNSDYKNMTGQTNINADILDDGAFVLNNGMLFSIENCPGCNPTLYGKDHALWVTVDINGKNKRPNRWGYDLFTFQVTKDGVLPLGSPGTDSKFSATPETYCEKGKNVALNGATCAFQAASNQDYFKEIYNGH